MGLIISTLTSIALGLVYRLCNAKWYYAAQIRNIVNKAGPRLFKEYDSSLTQRNLKELGILPRDLDWKLEGPSQSKKEHVIIIGSNLSGQSLILQLDRSPLAGTSKIGVTFRDSDNSVYTYVDETADDGPNEYKARGFRLQILNPCRQLRISLTGLMRRTTNGADSHVFVRLAMFWYPLTNIFEHQRDFNRHFAAAEMANVKRWKLFPFNHFANLYEDMYEQYGQLKGTVTFDSADAKEIYLWGSRVKKFSTPAACESIRIFGYSQVGRGFHIGTISNADTNAEFRYGNFYYGHPIVSAINKLTLTANNIRKLVESSGELQMAIEFDVAVDGPRKYKIQINNLTAANNIIFGSIKLNGKDGTCVLLVDREDLASTGFARQRTAIEDNTGHDDNYVVKLQDPSACRTYLTGGKGTSLANLTLLSNSAEFVVPRGIVVTTRSYDHLLRNDVELKLKIDELENYAWSRDRTEMREKCEKMVEFLSMRPLPNEIKAMIASNLDEFDLTATRFAVRSSAANEDTDDMSAAGQMVTLLGVNGIQQIYAAVMQCWASQFTYVAVEYKRAYGQLINLPMAVVIQEMVNSDKAGVMFSCDPLTGDPRIISIAANHGLGESVVSGMSDPDTFTVHVDRSSDTIGKIDVVIGSKAKVIQLGETDGTVDVENTMEGACLSDDEVSALAKVGLNVDRHFGSPRDMEWAIRGGQIYMLQSRPVTHVDKYTDWELFHESDSGQKSDNCYCTRAHVGVSLPGAVSKTMMTLFPPLINFITYNLHKKMGTVANVRYSPLCPMLEFYYNQTFLNITQFGAILGDRNSVASRTVQISFFGHEIENDSLFDALNEKIEEPLPGNGLVERMKMFASILQNVIMCGRRIHATKQNYKDFDLLPGKSCSSSKQLFDFFLSNYYKLYEPAFRHVECSTATSVCYMSMFTLLSQVNGITPTVLNDVALILSSCNDVVSADVPKSIDAICRAIEDRDQFRLMEDDAALQYLRRDQGKAGSCFREFLRLHGHRGLKEMDVFFRPWDHDPMPVIRSIKGTLQTMAAKANKVSLSLAETIDSLKTPVAWYQKLFLRYVVMPMTRNRVGYRENSKSFVIWMMNHFRKTMWKLADIMTYDEGRLPEPDLMFFLHLHEIAHLVQERDPSLVAKAKQRKRIFQQCNEFRFDEIVNGCDFRPINRQPRTGGPATHADGETFKLCGMAACGGTVTGRVFVAVNLEEAANIQSGDILVTFSTDIGWSPYFPLLGGLVTEVGGLISHGAVIAREYGLPCLIGSTNATHRFTTGDRITLDTRSGQVTMLQ